MPVLVLGFDGNPFDQRSIKAAGDRFITQLNQLKFSGSYPSGGDTLDWSNGGGTPAAPNVIPPAAQGVAAGPSRVVTNDNGPVNGVINLGGGYVLVPGTNPTNWKIKVFKTAGSEYSGAYLADVLTDTVILESEWAR